MRWISDAALRRIRGELARGVGDEGPPVFGNGRADATGGDEGATTTACNAAAAAPPGSGVESLQPPRPDTAGTRYEVLERLAAGGMGIVYRARDRELDREVALKVLQAGPVPPGAKARMLQEARILGRLEHPGIVPIHDVGRLPDGRTFYAMKLVRGRRLDEQAGAADSLGDLLRLFGRICDAVAFAHAHGVVHRDLKPENVMVGSFGEVLVMDWGVAKVLGGLRDGAEPSASAARPETARVTQTGMVIGTPGYMAPEQERGETDRVDERSDVFALGAILRFLMEEWDRRDAGEGTVAGAVSREGFRKRERTGAKQGAVPRPLAAICRRAMASGPAQRYSSVSDLAADVARFADGLPVSAYREGPLERAGRLFTKYRTPILLVLAYLLMRLLLLLVART